MQIQKHFVNVVSTLTGVLALCATGCVQNAGPRMPKELSAPVLVGYSQSDFSNDVASYRSALATGNANAALNQRNEIAYRIMADIEASYGHFEMSLTTSRAAVETTSDATQLGITAATEVVGAGDVKDILAATLSAFQGTRLSFDKNFYEEKTTEALISQMRASRKTLQAQLLLNLSTRDVSSYPLEAVWIDLVDFYYAGTVPSALVAISSNAGASAAKADTALESAVKSLTPTTPAQAAQAVDIRAAYQKLASAIGAGGSKATTATDQLREILTKAGYAPSADASGTELLSLFRQAMSDAGDSNDKLKSLSDAVAAASIH